MRGRKLATNLKPLPTKDKVYLPQKSERNTEKALHWTPRHTRPVEDFGYNRNQGVPPPRPSPPHTSHGVINKGNLFLRKEQEHEERALLCRRGQ